MDKPLTEKDLQLIRRGEQTRVFLESEAGQYFLHDLEEKERGYLTNLLADAMVEPVEVARLKGRVQSIRQVQATLRAMVDAGQRSMKATATQPAERGTPA